MTKKRLQRLNWFYVPAVVLMILFIAYPLGNAIYLSFFKWNGYSVKKDFIGVQNYISMFNDKTFVSSLKHIIVWFCLHIFTAGNWSCNGCLFKYEI